MSVATLNRAVLNRGVLNGGLDGSTPTPVPVLSYRDRDVYDAIKAILKATAHFDRVELGRPSYANRLTSDVGTWAAIQPLSDSNIPDGSPSRKLHTCSYVLTIGVRDVDNSEVTYRSRLDRAYAVAMNSLLLPANLTLGGLVLAGKTALSDGTIGASGYPGMTRTIHGRFAYSISFASSSFSTAF